MATSNGISTESCKLVIGDKKALMQKQMVINILAQWLVDGYHSDVSGNYTKEDWIELAEAVSNE